MPSQIDYSKRGWAENIFDPGAWRNLLSGVGEVATSVGTVWEEIEKIEGSQPLTPPPPPPPYNPNLTLGDFAFTPNATLVVVGGVLLLVALVLRGK